MRSLRKENDRFSVRQEQPKEQSKEQPRVQRFMPYTTPRNDKVKRQENRTFNQKNAKFTPGNNANNQTNSLIDTGRRTKPTEPCRKCGVEHKLWECTDVMNLELDERREMVRTWRLCFGCLSPTHTVNSCFRGVCRECRTERHSFALCPKARARLRRRPDNLRERNRIDMRRCQPNESDQRQ